MKLDLRKSSLQLFSRQLVRLKYVQHIQNDLDKENTHKFSHKINYLNQTYVFHLVAYWQDFIESLVKRKFSDIKSGSGEHVLDDVLNLHVDNQLKRFNTPNTENIDQLFKDTLGLIKITNSWETAEFSKSEAKKYLEQILNSRHQIAHKGSTSKELSYASNFDDMNFIFKLAVLLQSAVDKHDV
ncbi:MAG: HEPN domain-containing protein [Colwellia sp.]|nr:HEPN domain-containing protein [Colwellia sp.]